MGCQCADNTRESKSELQNINSKELVENILLTNKNNKIDILKSSISDSLYNSNLNYNLQNNSSKEKKFTQISTEIKDELNSDQNKIQRYENYPRKMFELINSIRGNPSSYADEIENSIENIWEEKSKNDNEKNKIVYKQRVKVALNRGEIAFKEAAKELREISPLGPLEFKEEICIPLPEIEEDIKNANYLKEQVKIIRQNNNINVFYKDLIKDPEVSALLMIVDDSIKNPGKKRQAVLDNNFKYIGISSGFVGKSFIAYFSFSKY